ncbi:[protein-PII] uridylyltransferase [Maricaulis sp. MIT060901]|uniref:[protein-PII] uridylyltransferase n=1 Tax=Maricaulis sp. MIT060901 TaxID=3096993 RepID=UPI00399AF713
MTASFLPASLESLKLRARLASAMSRDGWDSPSARKAGLATLRASLETSRNSANTLLAGDHGGAAAAHALADGVSVCLGALFDSLAAEDPEGARGVALCAQGGFGAGELAPYSDVDLMLLKPGSANGKTDEFLQRVLYALWDLKIDVGGGACRTIEETLELAREDASERTALLSLRYIAGNQNRVTKLAKRFRDEVVSGDEIAFVEAKLRERDARIEKAGRSRYTVEPHLKAGKGGLRDLQLMRWLALFLYGADAFERWVGDRLLSVDDVERYVAADDFLWTVRFHLHQLAGGKDERLSFELQPEIAKRMGFEDTETESGVERFMRRYFFTAMHVGSLTRLVCSKLEADSRKAKPKNLARFLPNMLTLETADTGSFILRDGRLDFANPTQIADDPAKLMQFFHVAASRQFDLHPEAVARIGRTLSHVDDDYRRDPRVARAFFAVLLDAPAPMAVLRLMTEAGLLGRYIPEYGDIVARTQFNMYHRYTVDEHTLQAIGLLREIEQGLHVDEHPLSTGIISEIKNRRALHLAVLLHDTGKGNGDQCIEGAARALTACERLGLDAEESELVAWLIENHLLMSDTAQRRDIGDPRTIADFAQVVGSVERLRLLTVLTVVDIRSVGPGVWNGWKAQLMRDLYAAVEPVLQRSGDAVELAREALAEKADAGRSRVCDRLQRSYPEFADFWREELDDTYWVTSTEEDRFRHAAFARQARARGDGEAATAIRVDRRRKATELMIWTEDRFGLFADLVSALARRGADIVGATINTTRSGKVLDIFYIQDAGSQPFGWDDPYLMDELVAYVREIVSGAREVERSRETALKRSGAAFKVTPYLNFSNDLSDSATVIEASGRDRPGLLADLSDMIAKQGLSLHSARIDGYGERATDVFYVTREGAQLTDEALKAEVEEALMNVLSEGEAQLEAQAAQRGIARAPASLLR